MYNDIERKDIDHTINGECSNCGRCCQAILPLSEKEIQRIKSYIGKNNIKPFNRHNVMDTEFIDVCPFMNPDDGKCVIYPIRPEVCSRFLCSDYGKPTAKHFNATDKKVVNMYKEFLPDAVFPCPEIDLLKVNKVFNEQKSKVAHNYFRKKSRV